MALVATAGFDGGNRVASFFVQAEDQALFDYVINSVRDRSPVAL